MSGENAFYGLKYNLLVVDLANFELWDDFGEEKLKKLEVPGQ